MFILSIIFLIISGILFIIVCKKAEDLIEIDNKRKKENEEILLKNTELKAEMGGLEEEIKRKQEKINSQQEYLDQGNEILKKASENYAEMLEFNYREKENEYDELIEKMQNNYSSLQDEMIAETRSIQKDLDKISSTRAAAIQAQIKEKEIKEDLSFYCLTPSEEDLDDVKTLERIKPKLHQPRILCMLIWSTYFQKPMTALCNNVLGTTTIIGIYKITNQQTGECYVGQSVDVAKRWKDHAKCGLGIDTPANNKLYQAIQDFGIWSFSWELLEQCSKEELDEKEAFYIDLYQAKEYGYNSIKGNKKS